MKFEETFDFDYPAETILKMFGDKDYYLKKYERMGGDAPEVLDTKAEGDKFSITVRHALDASRMSFPDFIKSRLGDSLYLKQTDAWQLDQARGRIDIDIEKAPVAIHADMHLENQGSGSRMTLAYEIDASIPLIGGKVEKAVAGPIAKHTKKDLKITNEMAADYA